MAFEPQSGRLSIGDPEHQLVVDWEGASVRLIPSADGHDCLALDELWIDLMPPSSQYPAVLLHSHSSAVRICG